MHLVTLQSMRQYYSHTQTSTAVYMQVLIHTAEWTGQGNERAQDLTQQHRI